MKTLYTLLCESYCDYPHILKKEIQEIVAFVVGKTKEDLFLSLDIIIDKNFLDKIHSLLEERSYGKPLAYLLGFVDFYGCKIAVNSDVLIPRVETEILLDKILHEIEGHEVGVVLDLCCGSGCLGVAFKKQRQECSVYLSDLSQKALNIARCNARENQTDVEYLQGDLLEPFNKKGLKADLVMCNPPYISEEEFLTLENSVRDFEPLTALVSGPSGLEIFKKLSYTLPSCLNKGALVAFEIGSAQREKVIEIFSISPWKRVRCYLDYAGLDRFIFLEVE